MNVSVAQWGEMLAPSNGVLKANAKRTSSQLLFGIMTCFIDLKWFVENEIEGASHAHYCTRRRTRCPRNCSIYLHANQAPKKLWDRDRMAMTNIAAVEKSSSVGEGPPAFTKAHSTDPGGVVAVQPSDVPEVRAQGVSARWRRRELDGPAPTPVPPPDLCLHTHPFLLQPILNLYTLWTKTVGSLSVDIKRPSFAKRSWDPASEGPAGLLRVRPSEASGGARRRRARGQPPAGAAYQYGVQRWYGPGPQVTPEGDFISHAFSNTGEGRGVACAAGLLAAMACHAPP